MIFLDAPRCWFCDYFFHKEEDVKDRDHCRIKPNYDVAAHTRCNLIMKQRLSSFMPIALPDVIEYDSN